MTDWQPKLGDTVMVVNPKGYGIAESAKHVVGSNAIFHAVVNSVKKSASVGIVEDAGGGFHCFRMDMLAQTVDPRRAVLSELVEHVCALQSGYEHGSKAEAIDKALAALTELAPF